MKWGPWPKGYEGSGNPYKMKGTQYVGNVVLLQGKGDCVPCLEEGCERHIAKSSDCMQNSGWRVVDALCELKTLRIKF